MITTGRAVSVARAPRGFIEMVYILGGDRVLAVVGETLFTFYVLHLWCKLSLVPHGAGSSGTLHQPWTDSLPET